MRDWIDDVLIPTAMGILAILAVGFFVSCGAEVGYFDRKAFAAKEACLQRRMRPDRKLLSTDVICVPDNARQDTTTVNVR